MKLTSKTWQKLFPTPRVIDPDGWDRKNYDYSWNIEKITYMVNMLKKKKTK